MLLDYLATSPNSTLQYYASIMELHTESDAAYLVLPGAKKVVLLVIFIYKHLIIPIKYTKKGYNTPLHIECSTIKNIAVSAAEAECGEFSTIAAQQ